MNKNKILLFVNITFFVSICNVYSAPNYQKTYEFDKPKQFIINMSREAVVDKLRPIVSVYDDGSILTIPDVRMINLMNRSQYDIPIGLHAFTLLNGGDAVFTFYAYYNNGSLYLTKSEFKGNALVDWDLEMIGKIIENVFYQNIIKYLIDEIIRFDYITPKNIILPSDIHCGYFHIYENTPTNIKEELLHGHRTWPSPIYLNYGWTGNNKNNERDKISKSLLKLEWIISEVTFPDDYTFIIFPTYQIGFDIDVNELRHLSQILIWKNGNQYFACFSIDYMRSSPPWLPNPDIGYFNNNYYSINIEKINAILSAINIQFYFSE
jgi:hypothetical protein